MSILVYYLLRVIYSAHICPFFKGIITNKRLLYTIALTHPHIEISIPTKNAEHLYIINKVIFNSV